MLSRAQSAVRAVAPASYALRTISTTSQRSRSAQPALDDDLDDKVDLAAKFKHILTKGYDGMQDVEPSLFRFLYLFC
jgi:hypothetical protein